MTNLSKFNRQFIDFIQKECDLPSESKDKNMRYHLKNEDKMQKWYESLGLSIEEKPKFYEDLEI